MQPKVANILAALLFICAFTSAQNYPFVQYTPKDGLVNSRVRKVYQDSRGRIYFLTYGGLSVYDGSRFMNYTIQNGLGANLINDVLELGDDSLLIATNTSELNVLVHGKIKLFTTGKASPVINQFLKSADGHIYAVADQGLYVLKEQHLELLPFAMLHPEIRNPYLGTIVEFEDFLIIGTNDLRGYKGLYLYDKKNSILTDVLPDKFVSSLGKDKNNTIWISGDSGVYRLDAAYLHRGKIQLAPLAFPYKKLSTYKGSFLSFDDHNVWLTNHGKEIIKAGDNGSITTINFTDRQITLSNNPVFIDHENIIWVCTEGNGVVKLIGTDFRTQQPTFGALTPAIIHSSLYISDTTWYFLKPNSLVRVTEHENKKFVGNYTPDFFCIGQFNGHLVAGNGRSIFSAKLPPPGNDKIHFVREFTMPVGVSLGAKCFIDPNGNIILCNNQLLVVHHNKIIDKLPVLSDDLIEGIATDYNKQLWILTRYDGLSVYTEHPTDTAHYLHRFLSLKNEFKNISPRCMLLDEKSHIIWIGTRYGGVMSFKLMGNRLKKIQQFQIEQGLTDDFVTALARDSSGNIIVGTQAGLDRLLVLDSNHYRIENVTKENNIFGFIANIWVNKVNETYALSNTGTLFQLSPFGISSKRYQPKLFIEEMTVNGRRASQEIANLHLPYNSQNITFNIAAPTYVDEKQVLYSYQLSGNSRGTWSTPSSNASLNLLNLSPGTYALFIKALFPSTGYSPKDLSFHFIINPPWWQSWWFLTVITLA